MIFIPNFVCVLTNKDIKHIKQDSHSVTWVMPQEWNLGALGAGWGAGWGAQGVKHIFFRTCHVTYLIDGDDEHNRMQVKILPQGKTGDLGVR